MRFTVSATIDAPRDMVWAALADYGGIATWNTDIDASRIVSGSEQGVGAERQCDFGNKYLRERVREWEPGKRLSLDFTHFPAPLRAAVTFQLSDAVGTRVAADYWFQGKGLLRPFGWMLKPLLRKAISGVLRDLKAHIEAPGVGTMP